ncbi:hypothetical protein, partial [Burkholderia vietnamiensis]|uniref:hypothetical protein n=1 Tax=Burkholderia vietnamiensis TaxID=60552 RepID=UPI001B9D259F
GIRDRDDRLVGSEMCIRDRPASLPPIRRPHRPRRPASDAQPLAAAPRDDNSRAAAAAKAANAGTAH